MIRPPGRHRGRRRPAVVPGAGLLAAVLALSACTGTPPWAGDRGGPGPRPTAAAPDSGPGGCPAPTVAVASAGELTRALATARPGDVIGLAPGTYRGRFTATASGTAERPVWLCGPASAVLDGGDPRASGYAFHLDHASYWHLTGFTITRGRKGLMADATRGSVVSRLTVHAIGDEGIHLRQDSTDNTVTGNTVFDTGLRKEKFGEGIYVGTAESNWCDVTGCRPDESDRNVISKNTIRDTTAENVDIKEGTSTGRLVDNSLDGAGTTAADSWVDVKGNGWIIEGNSGKNAPGDGFQTHEVLAGWGTKNVFRNNTAPATGNGLGFALRPPLGNVVECNNTVPDGSMSNATCTQ